MKRWIFVCLFTLSFVLCAASCLDTATGVEQDPKTGKYEKAPPGAAPIDWLGGLVPWGGMATSLLGNLWLAYRNRSWSAAATSTISGVEQFFGTVEGEKVKEKLKELLIKEQDKLGIQPLVGKVLERLKG